MKIQRFLFFVILLGVLTMSFALAETILVSDDFNRADNQDISETYLGDFLYYETPINHIYTTHPYNGEEEVKIDNNQLYSLLNLPHGKGNAISHEL